ncbi:TPA: integrase arm-type DNA-binding domain-containing protein, partial [Salmonella enterica]
MARITRPLTNNEILKAKPREKDFTLHDGDGLFLLVKTTGKKLWRFRYQRPGSSSRTNLSLGGTVAKLAMRQPFVLFKGLTFQKLCLPGAFR